MGQRVRSLIATFVAVIAISMTVTPALAVTEQQYNSNLRLALSVVGTCRTYSGSAIHIQLTTIGASSSKYSISVYHCSGGHQDTLVGSAGGCNVNAFCGYVWAITLAGQQYGFFFNRTAGDGRDTIFSQNYPANTVQMWSTS